ncbi:hypothetical protein [Fibrisoma limi]|nr:hypothetical protein [Fibrisoma limi]
MAVTKDGAELASLTMNWLGQVVLMVRQTQEYVLKAPLFQGKYVLENQDGELIIQYDPTFNCRQFNYKYDISYKAAAENNFLVLLGVYGATYYIATMSGATAGLI